MRTGQTGQRPRERTPVTDTIGKTVKAERTLRDLRQVDVYQAAGVSRSVYINIEKGHRVPDVSQLGRIADALGMSLSEFFARVEANLGTLSPPPSPPPTARGRTRRAPAPTSEPRVKA